MARHAVGGLGAVVQETSGSPGARVDGGTPAQLGVRFGQNLIKQYFDAAEACGRTGNPGLGPPGTAPTHSEKLSELTQEDPSLLHLRLQVQAREKLDALASRGPLFQVRVELNEDRAGTLSDVTLLETSGSQRFDDFILRAMPEAVARAGPPPAELVKDKRLFRTQWRVEGWLRSNSKTSLIGISPFGLPIDQLAAALDNVNARIEYRAKLLRVY